MRLREVNGAPLAPAPHGFFEGIPLLFGSYDFFLTTLVCILGIMAGDSILFWIGRKRGTHFLSHRWVRPFLSERKMAKTRHYFERYGMKTVFVARFFSGVRMVVYFAAGCMGMRAWKFYLLDLAGCFISVPISIYVGHYFGHDINQGLRRMKEWNHLFVAAVAVVVLFSVLLIRLARKAAVAHPVEGESPTDGGVG